MYLLALMGFIISAVIIFTMSLRLQCGHHICIDVFKHLLTGPKADLWLFNNKPICKLVTSLYMMQEKVNSQIFIPFFKLMRRSWFAPHNYFLICLHTRRAESSWFKQQQRSIIFLYWPFKRVLALVTDGQGEKGRGEPRQPSWSLASLASTG